MNKKTWWNTVNEINQTDLVLFGIPYDFSASFQKGTVEGPSEFRDKMEFAAETWSPYQNFELTDLKIYDAGDVKVNNKLKPSFMNDEVEKFVDNILKHPVKTIMIGGEHSVTYPVFKSHFKKHQDLHLIHFDAHTDLRDEFYGEPFSHACVVKKCIDLIGPNKTFQFGIRSGSKEEFDLHNKLTYIEKSTTKTVEKIAKQIKDKPLYITIDIDVLDPSIAPGTGTPEAGGISYEDLINALQNIKKHVKNIVGIDLVELSPKVDLSNRTTALAVKLMREAIIMLFKN